MWLARWMVWLAPSAPRRHSCPRLQSFRSSMTRCVDPRRTEQPFAVARPHRVTLSAEEFLGSPYPNDTSCVITDVPMQAMGGLELLANMRLQGYAASFIVITAFQRKLACIGTFRRRYGSSSGLLPAAIAAVCESSGALGRAPQFLRISATTAPDGL
jgi:CheY-like chemotaxis protein